MNGEEITEVDDCDDNILDDDLCIIIRTPVEVLGVDKYHQMEQVFDMTLGTMGFVRIGTDKLKYQIYIHYKKNE